MAQMTQMMIERYFCGQSLNGRRIEMMHGSPDDSRERDPQTFAIIGAAMMVHSELGRGFLEPVYQEAMERELRHQDIPFNREHLLPVYYRDEPLTIRYRADFLCYDEVIVELKALPQITGTEESQVINYLKAARKVRALLLNFGAPRLEYKRFVHDPNRPPGPPAE